MSEELKFREWLPKLSERLFFILLSIKEKRDIAETDWDLLQYFHKVYWLGELPFYKHKPNMTDEKALQQGLFGQTDMTAQKGTKVDYKLSDKKLKENGNNKV